MDEIIEAAARAVVDQLRKSDLQPWLRDYEPTTPSTEEMAIDGDICPRELARAAIAAIMPAIGERMAGRALHQAEVNAKAREDRADDELAFEFRGIGNVIAADLRALASTMAAEVGKG